MKTLATVLSYEMLILLAILILIVGYRLITQQININGLLMDKTSGRNFSPGRLQMLVVTMGIAIYYVYMVINSKNTAKLPDMPQEYLLALGGSHTAYLGGKFYGLIASRLGLASPKMEERVKPKEKKDKPENGG